MLFGICYVFAYAPFGKTNIITNAFNPHIIYRSNSTLPGTVLTVLFETLFCLADYIIVTCHQNWRGTKEWPFIYLSYPG